MLRLCRLRFEVPTPESPEHRPYELLARDDPDGARGRYNAMIRRLVSFERAAECVASDGGTAVELFDRIEPELYRYPSSSLCCAVPSNRTRRPSASAPARLTPTLQRSVSAPRSQCKAVERNLIRFSHEGPASSTGPGGISEFIPAGTSRPDGTLRPSGRSTSMAQTRSRRSPYQSGVAVSPSIVMPVAAR